MRFNLRMMVLVLGCTWLIGASVARAQTPPTYYYPAPGVYATTRGTISIPAVGYYYNVPLYTIPASGYAAPIYTPVWDDRSAYNLGRYSYPGALARGFENTPAVAPDTGHEDFWLFLRE